MTKDEFIMNVVIQNSKLPEHYTEKLMNNDKSLDVLPSEIVNWAGQLAIELEKTGYKFEKPKH